MTVDYSNNYLRSVRSLLSTIIYPLQYVVSIPTNTSNWLSNILASRTELLKENSKLKQQHLLLSSKLQRYKVLESENNRLRKLLESSFHISNKVRIARLIEVQLQPFSHQVVINQGSRIGAYNGQAILDAYGIMGQIINAGTFSSTVLLITDLNHAIPVQINRNGLRAIAVGMGQNDKLSLEYLPINSDIKVGDLVISSGLGQLFPSGYPVGVVESIKIEPSKSFIKVIITPSSQLSKNTEVLMLWKQEALEN